MLLRTHLAASLTLAAACAPPHHFLSAGSACIIGAWIPDLDLHLVVRPGATPFTRSPLRHRGFTHSLLFLILVSGATALASVLLAPVSPLTPLLAFFVGGFLSHVALDACTRSPVYFIWPSSSPLHFPSLLLRKGAPTGGAADHILFFTLSLAFLTLAALRFSELLPIP